MFKLEIMTRLEKKGGEKGGVDKFVFCYLKRKKKKTCLNEYVAQISAAFSRDGQRERALLFMKGVN